MSDVQQDNELCMQTNKKMITAAGNCFHAYNHFIYVPIYTFYFLLIVMSNEKNSTKIGEP